MKFQFSLSIILLIFLCQSCTVKFASSLKEIQQAEISTSWEKLTSYPIDYGRSDDLHFFDPLTGYVINSDGYLSFTEDGGKTWEIVLENKGTFFRCITFKNRQEGWLGTIGTGDKSLRSRDTIALYETKDGGENWSPVKFNGPDPKGLCGLQKVSDQMIVGTGRVRGPSFFIKTTDGGATWNSYDMNHLAGSLIATYFSDEQHGFLIGGTTQDKENSRSLVLETLDGGTSWDTIYLSEQIGEYPWKFSFPTADKGFISIQRNERTGRFYHLQTEDAGKSWREVEHAPKYYYTQGIGFIDENIGWIGGSNTWTYETRDGGESWNKKKGIGNGFNNFQFFGDSLAYGVGFGVFKNSDVQSSGLKEQKIYYDNGELRGKFTLQDGKRNGLAELYSQDGKLESKGEFNQNLRIGKWKYYDSLEALSRTVKMRKNGTVRVSKKVMNSYVGEYKTGNGVLRKILLENDQLYSQFGNRRKIPIFPETEDQFFYGINPDIKIAFIKDEHGLIKYARMYQSGEFAMAEKQ